MQYLKGHKFPKGYFEDEVRDGFYVSAMVKRSWAVQLEVLEVVDKICKRHSLQYFAEGGTLLGAIRHGGFIPWDDDLDICMKREDYETFAQIALEELPEGYVMRNFEQSGKENYSFDNFLIRINNSRKIRTDEEFLERFHGFPYVAGVDIFSLDGVAPTEKADKRLLKEIETVSTLADAIDDMSPDEKNTYLLQAEKAFSVKFDRSRSLRPQFYMLADRLCGTYKEKDAKYLTNMAFRTLRDFKVPKEYYADVIMLPFEHIQIPVPVGYDAFLRTKYGDYMKPVHSGGGHDYPFYQKQADKLNTAHPLFQKYVFSQSDLYREESDKENQGQLGLKVHAKEMMKLFGAVRDGVVGMIRQGTPEYALELLADCQDGVIALGNKIEEAKGNGCRVVAVLEQFCEVLYTIYESISNGGSLNADAVDRQFEEILALITERMQKDIIERKVAVFLPYKASLWDSLESVWKAADEDPDCDAYVIPIPYCEKEFDGTMGEIHYEGNQFPDDVPITDYETFDFALQHPDMIFFHNPYDEYNLAATVPPMFYAKELRKYTDNLIYIPWFVLDEIKEGDMRGNISMDYFCTMPGVVCADKVIVQSEQMRKAYIRKLTEFAGEDTGPVWEKKILGLGSPVYDKERERRNSLQMPEDWEKVCLKDDGNLKKFVLYNTVPEAMLEHGSAMLDKIRSVLEIFKGQKEEVALAWCANMSKSDYVQRMSPELWGGYQQLVQEYRNAGWGVYCDLSKDDEKKVILKFSDAYYGDPDNVATLCRQNGMAVMIQDVGKTEYE